MAEQTGISWADSTANFWIGCQKVSAACDHCYAEDLMGTEGSRLKRAEWGPHGERIYCKQGWTDVKKWQRRAEANGGLDPELGRRRRIFVNSLSDFFDNHRSVKWRGDAWHIIRRSPHLIFMLVTKRPQLIGRYLPPFWDDIAERVWLITTAENQEWFDRRIPELLTSCAGRTQPAVFGVSCEPLLGPIQLDACYTSEPAAYFPLFGAFSRDYLGPDEGGQAMFGDTEPMGKLGWVIVGGESGREARPAHPDWYRSLRDQCGIYGVPFHFKQWGEWAPDCLCGRAKPCPETPRPQPGPRGCVFRCGKTAAGHRLDGREHLEVPCVA